MRTILDTSTGYGTACVIDVKGGGDKFVICSVVSFLKENCGTHHFDAGRIPRLRSRQWWMRSPSVCQMIALSSKSCQRRQFPRVMRVWVFWMDGTIFLNNLLQGQIRALRLDVEDRFGSIVGVTHQCVPWLVRHATWLLNRFQRRQNGATAFENFQGMSYKNHCWLEAERITHKYDPRW